MISSKGKLIVVMGDVHHHLGLAAEGLEKIERELECPIAQVFSVGDLGLFLDESDWAFLTGPKKYRSPEQSPKIRQAWQDWRWPVSMIAGNHEPFHRLRDWQPEYFLNKLKFTNAGEVEHAVSGLRVAGLSGIYHPEELEFVTPLERRNLKLPPVSSWAQMLPLVQAGKISRSRLTYYKQFELDTMKHLDFRPNLLLLHDWPITPDHVTQVHQRRPEEEIVAACRAPFVCCGHHHRAADFSCHDSRVLALNIISTPERIHHHYINPGWCALFSWASDSLEFLQTWPQP